jgi:hypothetical protein
VKKAEETAPDARREETGDTVCRKKEAKEAIVVYRLNPT